MTLKELLPHNNASAYFNFYEDEYGQEGELDLSAANIQKVTGRVIKLTSIDGIDQLKIKIDNLSYDPKQSIAGLNLTGNALTDLPDTLRFFPLYDLSVEGNRLEFIPGIIYELLHKKLRSINIRNNQIENLPKDFSTLSANIFNNLVLFDIGNNPIEKDIILKFFEPMNTNRFAYLVLHGKIRY